MVTSFNLNDYNQALALPEVRSNENCVAGLKIMREAENPDLNNMTRWMVTKAIPQYRGDPRDDLDMAIKDVAKWYLDYKTNHLGDRSYVRNWKFGGAQTSYDH